MATSLMDQLKRQQDRLLRVNGQLQKTTGSEIQQIAKSQQQLMPTSPLAAQLMGASDHSSKMMGTPQQEKAALAINVQSPLTLQQLNRTQQLRNTPNEAEALQYQKSQNLAQAGSIGDAISKYVQSYIPQVAQTLPSVNFQSKLPPELQQKLNAEQLAQFEQLVAAPSLEAAAPLAAALGVNPLDYIEVAGTGESAAKILPNASTITVGQLFQNGNLQQSIGMDSNQLANLLGIDPIDVAEMSVEKFQKQVRKIQQTEFSEIEKLRNVVNDMSVSPSQRQQARQQLLNMGATGIATAEANVDKLNEAVQNADQITVGDETKSVEEFLSDENISQLIDKYLKAEGEEKTKLAGYFGPDLTAFVDQHQAALEEAASQLQSIRGTATQIREANASLANVGSGITLNEEAMNTLIPGWNQFQTSQLSKPAILQVFDDPSLSTNQRTQLASVLNSLPPEQLNRLKDMSIGQLNQIGLLNNSQKWQGMQAAWELTDRLNIIPDGQTDSIVNAIESQIGIEDLAEQLKFASQFGSPNELTKILDPDGDGILNTDSLKANVLDYLNTKQDGRLGQSPLIDTKLYDSVKKYMQDGSFDPADLTSVIKLKDVDTRNQLLTQLINSDNKLVKKWITQEPQAIAGLLLEPLKVNHKPVFEWQNWREVSESSFDKYLAEASKILGPKLGQAMPYVEGYIEGQKEKWNTARYRELQQTLKGLVSSELNIDAKNRGFSNALVSAAQDLVNKLPKGTKVTWQHQVVRNPYTKERDNIYLPIINGQLLGQKGVLTFDYLKNLIKPFQEQYDKGYYKWILEEHKSSPKVKELIQNNPVVRKMLYGE